MYANRYNEYFGLTQTKNAVYRKIAKKITFDLMMMMTNDESLMTFHCAFQWCKANLLYRLHSLWFCLISETEK